MCLRCCGGLAAITVSFMKNLGSKWHQTRLLEIRAEEAQGKIKSLRLSVSRKVKTAELSQALSPALVVIMCLV